MVRHFPILENSETELSVDPRNGRRNNTTRSALGNHVLEKKSNGKSMSWKENFGYHVMEKSTKIFHDYPKIPAHGQQ